MMTRFFISLSLTILASASAFVPTKSTFGVERATSLYAATLEGREIGGELQPTNNFVLVVKAEVQDKTDSGIFLTGSAKIEKTEGTVKSVGPGKTHPESGKAVPMPVAAGDGVVYGKYDGTEVDYNGARHTLIRDDDILVKFTGDTLTLDSVEAVNDNFLVHVEINEESTSGGLLIAKTKDSVESRPSTGEVVKVGPGKMASDGKLIPMNAAVGDKVKFRDFAGNEVTIEEKEYSVVSMADILAKF